MKKRIAISCHYASFENKYRHYGPGVEVRDYYLYPFFQVGAIPFILPSIPFDDEILRVLLHDIHGIVLFGGLDVDPLLYGETVQHNIQRYELRDHNEIALVRYAIQHTIPLFGICRGMQIINVACGGTLYQDLPAQHPGLKTIHSQNRDDVFHYAHTVTLSQGGFLSKRLGKKEMSVNSYHHQAVKKIGTDLIVSAVSGDDVIEAIEHTTLPIAGVQWHPEFIFHRDVDSKNIISSVVTQLFL